MSKEFNLPAFVANFGRIIDNEIKALGGREAARAAKYHYLLDDEGAFYTGIIYFGEEVTADDIQVSCHDLFKKHKNIVCNDQLYIENRNQYEQFSPKINDIIANEAELAARYLEEQKGYMNDLAHANNLLLTGESPSQDLHEPTE